MKVIKITPRGYCHGVVNALQVVAKVLADESISKPIYLLGEIVHNQNITDVLTKKGIITLKGSSRRKMLDQVTTGTVIITAHGIDPHLITKATNKGLNVVDATCIDVYKTHDVITEKLNHGYDVIYIGKQNHPEPEGAIGINPTRIHLVSNITDIENLQLANDKLCITNQTTMSVWDTAKIMKQAKKLYPTLEIINEICNSTSMRQEAVSEMAKLCDLTVVVGDPKSNNTNRLVQISEEIADTPAIRVNNLEELDTNILLDYDVIGVTSGASTPTIITSEIINFIENFDKNDENTWDNTSKINHDRIIPRAKHT
ncbi:4-hydroxy-3-methylbut-2-enyl diphosphate reductase [Mollicutes bacterium LVI A0078]|nr:4-hydroxy-3-methylbut-2-enyl diphosphate reductase [Mollicutes bacterium LVI A0075]WOO90607.1 4-hydroxy-3-methylbut-2-enyl diphosphate reductase [Mollicutes bacterium LVI A0078]